MIAKVKKASVKIVKPKSLYTIKVLGQTIHIVESNRQRTTILRIGHTSKIIEGSRLFSILDKKIQEFMVHNVLCLLKSKAKGNNRYFKVDKMALDFIKEKYPKKPMEYWYSAFTAILSDTFPSDLNVDRAIKFYK